MTAPTKQNYTISETKPVSNPGTLGENVMAQ
jgi:hypothetical protein